MVTYDCPRCGYQTNHRQVIKRHLYGRKKTCKNVKGLELTDQIKEIVLNDGHHFPSKSDISNHLTTINNTINNQNLIINGNLNGRLMRHLNLMTTEEKRNRLLKLKGKRLIDFEDQLDNQFENRIKKLETNSYSVPY